jgi:putative FmdB family regulatory protein
MPVYVYKNLDTGDTFELEQRITEPALTTHPQTGHPIRRLIQPVGIAFKGSGFYVTDSRNGSSKPSSKSETSSSESTTTKADAPTSDTKSESETKTPVSSAKSE